MAGPYDSVIRFGMYRSIIVGVDRTKRKVFTAMEVLPMVMKEHLERR